VLDASGKPFMVDARGIRPCRKITLENAASLFAQVARQCSLKVSDLEPYLEKIDALTDPRRLKERIRSLTGASGGCLGKGFGRTAGKAR